MAKNSEQQPKITTKPEDKAPKEPKEKEVKEESVSLPKATLEAILSRLESTDAKMTELIDANKKKDEQIEMLTQISDKGRLAKWQEQNKGTLIRTAKVSFWNGLPILAWETVKDEVGFRDGRLVVNQKIRIYLDKMIEDEAGNKKPATEEIDYVFWTQNVQTESGEIVEKSQANNREYYTIEMKDGRRIKLDIRYINAF